MSELLSEAEFTSYLIDQLSVFGLPITSSEPLVIEVNYGEEEPMLAIPLKNAYTAYKAMPEKLKFLLEPYITEISWTVQVPRYSSKEIFEKTMPVMKDMLINPIPQEGETVTLSGKEIVMRLPKGPILFQELVDRPEEHLVVQFMIEHGRETLELCRGDVLTCFPEPNQIAGIGIQNLARRALKSGLTTRSYHVENFKTDILLVGFRDEKLNQYVASLVNITDVMSVLQKNLRAPNGLLVIVPTSDQMLVTTTLDEQSVCEMGLLANYLKQESTASKGPKPVSGLIWRFKDGEVVGLQTVKLEEPE